MEDEILKKKERIEEIEKEKRSLTESIRFDKEQKLKHDEEMRKIRDSRLDMVKDKLLDIQSNIYAYNKLGKVKKIDVDIFGDILKIINIVDSRASDINLGDQ